MKEKVIGLITAMSLSLNLMSCGPSQNNSVPVSNPVSTSAQTPVIKPEMILLQGGKFQMGSNSSDSSADESPVHSVTLNSFYIGKYEILQKEYLSMLTPNPSRFKNDDTLPVESVTWFDAIKYCNELSKKDSLPPAYNVKSGELLDASGKVTTDVTKVKGYRLPTEAEWEYAAKGGDKSGGFKYSGSNTVDEIAVYEANSYIKDISSPDYGTHKAGSLKTNEQGLFDMSGNVWEWVQDWYDPYNSNTVTNPYISSGSSSRVLRGGSWIDRAVFQRVSCRYYLTPETRYSDIGFRIVRSAP